MKILIFLLLLNTCSATELPSNLNLIKTHIQNHADFSVDPCDNFYEHVCPEGGQGSFMKDLMVLKRKLIDKYFEEHPELHRFGEQITEQNQNALFRFIESNQINQLCSFSPEVFEIWAQSLDEKFNSFSSGYGTSPCALIDFIRAEPRLMDRYLASRHLMLQAISGSAAHIQLKEADAIIRRTFEKLKSGVEKAIRKTPWARNNRGLDTYLEALENMTLTTWTNIHPSVMEAIGEYDRVMEECSNRLSHLRTVFSSETLSAICDVIATSSFSNQMKNPIPLIDFNDLGYILPDSSTQFNSNDINVYVGNAFLFLALTDKTSDLFGSIGFSLCHEIMHTFVIEDADEGSRLAPFWTNSSGCVEEQTRKTCETFGNGNCDTHKTFEEDAADLAGFRVVWEVYQKEFSRKIKVEGYDDLDEKQLFFYGSAVMFCDKNRAQNSQDVHTGFYQRINTMMSQMEDFEKAFQCKSTDRMVQNKAEHCELYGSGAPMTRKISND